MLSDYRQNNVSPGLHSVPQTRSWRKSLKLRFPPYGAYRYPCLRISFCDKKLCHSTHVNRRRLNEGVATAARPVLLLSPKLFVLSEPSSRARAHGRTMPRFQHTRDDTQPPIVQNKRERHALAFLYPSTRSGFPSSSSRAARSARVDTRAFHVCDSLMSSSSFSVVDGGMQFQRKAWYPWSIGGSTRPHG